MIANNRTDRSRSPHRSDNLGRRRDHKTQDSAKAIDNMPNVMNPMMMTNMFPQANMMMASGMYPNMMLPGPIMSGGMMPGPGMEIMQGLGGPPMAPAPAPPMEMGMMGGMMMDPSMMGMFSNMSGDIPTMQEKKELIFKHARLTPPDSGTPQPPRRGKPPGCRTIFVGGLPDKIRENIVREIFETYGRIHTLRLSKKNFCHIRFDREECSRDDQNDFERRQRQALRAQQVQMQQMNSQQEIVNRNINPFLDLRRRSPSPPSRVQPYTNASMVQLAEKLKNEEQFAMTLPTLLAWLERGECSKKNANQFYTMIQATNSHIRRLFNEKMQAEEELQNCKERVKNHIASVIEQLEQVAKVFAAASHQRVWDHFTKPQRKNIETWQKMTQEFSSLKEEYLEKFGDDRDGDYNGLSRASESEELQQLKRENESLQFQLEAYKNEIEVVKSDTMKEMEKFKAQFIARQALQVALDKNPPLPSPMVHPQGASLDYVVSYVRALFSQVSQATIHHVLQKHTDVFERTTSGKESLFQKLQVFKSYEANFVTDQYCEQNYELLRVAADGVRAHHKAVLLPTGRFFFLANPNKRGIHPTV
ncbi:hypothetical protein HW555_011832 [Spodoptera exigua]|uniref:RRM domain-containing protein n=1 Tax=Spodoptera exigua TaxID=7107 RepID=A0A835G892_SPOEX|nr:hypothetical protein HW555_011832 [Spodoptera exigua]